MSSPADWKRIEELQRLLEDGEANVSQMCELDSLRTEHSPDMAARLRRIAELLLPVIDSELSHPSTDEFNLADLSVKATEARELLALLTGEEGEGK